MALTPIPSGAEQGSLYLIDYDEDLWKALDSDRQDHCKAEWRKKANTAPNCRFVVLRLHPDELFPMHGNEKPYTEWQEPIDKASSAPFTVDATITVTLRHNAIAIDPSLRPAIMRALHEAGRPGDAWRVVTAGGNILEHGKL